MSKMTLVTDAQGRLVGAVQGHELSTKHNGLSVHLSFGDGHKVHKVEVDDDLTKITDPAAFEKAAAKHIPHR